jgi:hypothetical protein
MKKTLLASLLSLTIFLSGGALLVYAQSSGSPPPPPGQLPNPFKGGNSLIGLFQTIVNDILMPIGGVIAVLAFIYAGFLYVTARGNEGQVKTAHKALLYTAIGTAILLGAWVIAKVICQTIGQLGGPVCPV